MELKKIFSVNILFLFLLTLISCGVKNETSDTDVRKDVDVLIFQRKFGDAQSLLYKSAGETDRRALLSGIINRSLRIADITHDYYFLTKISNRIIKQNPREEYHAVLAYSLLRTGKYKESYAVAEEYLASNQWDSLKAEISYKYRHIIPDRYGVYTLITHNYYDNPEELYDLASKTDNSSLYLNSALLSVFLKNNQGKIPYYLEKAARKYPSEAAEIAFHNLNYRLSVQLAESYPSVFIPAAVDSYFILGDYPGACSYLAGFYDSELKNNWIMMFNYLWAFENVNNNLELSMIEKCSILYPGNPYFNLLYADFLNRSGNTAQAGSSLQSRLNSGESNLINAYYDFYLGSGRSENKFLSYFWNEIHSKGEDIDSNLLEFYLWYIYKRNNFEDLSFALQLVKNDVSDLYAGIFYSTYGFYTIGEKYLLSYAGKHPSWEIYYNLFLVSRVSENTFQSGEYLYQAEKLYFADEKNRTPVKTRLILHTLADYEYSLGNNQKCLSYLDTILKNDNTDSRALLLKSRILHTGE